MMRNGQENRRDLDIVGLIDMIFILLIFFIVTLATTSQTSITGRTDLKLPVMKGEDPLTELRTLGFRFELSDSAKWRGETKPDRIYVLEPENLIGDEGLPSFEEALASARADTAAWIRITPDVARVRREIANAIYAFDARTTEAHQVFSSVEVSAVSTTPFLMVDEILQNCAELEIDNIIFWSKYR